MCEVRIVFYRVLCSDFPQQRACKRVTLLRHLLIDTFHATRHMCPEFNVQISFFFFFALIHIAIKKYIQTFNNSPMNTARHAIFAIVSFHICCCCTFFLTIMRIQSTFWCRAAFPNTFERFLNLHFLLHSKQDQQDIRDIFFFFFLAQSTIVFELETQFAICIITEKQSFLILLYRIINFERKIFVFRDNNPIEVTISTAIPTYRLGSF